MNLIEALKQANGKPVRRHSWITGTLLKESCGGVAASSDGGKTWDEGGGGFLVQCKGNIFGDDWYVVEPKSRIEEAIENIFKPYAQSITGEIVVNLSTSYINRQVRRIVNLTLDEAADTLVSLADDGYVTKAVHEISKLKVKE